MSTTENIFGTTTACPHCESSKIDGRTHQEPKWRCNNCGDTFAEPVERSRKGTGGRKERLGKFTKHLLQNGPSPTNGTEIYELDKLAFDIRKFHHEVKNRDLDGRNCTAIYYIKDYHRLAEVLRAYFEINPFIQNTSKNGFKQTLSKEFTEKVDSVWGAVYE